MSAQLTPLIENLAYEATGLDLSASLDPKDAARLRETFEAGGLLVFKGVDFSAEDQRRFSSVFGEVRVRRGIATAAPLQDEGTQCISDTRPDDIFGNGKLAFHRDPLYRDDLLLGLMLYGVTTASSGSQTKFRSCTAMYDALDPVTAQKAEGVSCLHAFDVEGDYEKEGDLFNMSANSSKAWRPLLGRDKSEAKRAVWVADWNVIDLKGVDNDEGNALLSMIWEQSEATPEHVHECEARDILLWHNMRVRHARMPFDPTEPGTFRRTPTLCN